jgi:hypothetical protein
MAIGDGGLHMSLSELDTLARRPRSADRPTTDQHRPRAGDVQPRQRSTYEMTRRLLVGQPDK